MSAIERTPRYRFAHGEGAVPLGCEPESVMLGFSIEPVANFEIQFEPGKPVELLSR